MDWNEIPTVRGEPDFNNLLSILQHQVPSRPTLFEFFLNDRLYERLVPEFSWSSASREAIYQRDILAMARLGYDYCTILLPGFSFSAGVIQRRQGRTISLNEGSVIHSRADFDSFPWPDPDQADYDLLERLGEWMPKGMKLIPYTSNGLLENATDLVGYQQLCMLILDDPQLADDIFEQIGARLLRFYQRVVKYEVVGAAICNDDWGFKTQTMFSPKAMRQFVFPWQKRFVEAIHAAGKPAILHSCGHYERIIEDIITDMKFDGRHSYEDAIEPVEVAYERFHDRLAILGGIDVDFICRSAPEEVYRRSREMLERAAGRGSYALGTGNSVPDYVPDSGYFAMIRAALDLR